MSRVVVVNHVTLDGVMQGPGREEVLGHWNTRESPFRAALNGAEKHVASTTLREPLPWPNSRLLDADVPAAVAALKEQAAGDLHVMGSGELIRTLMDHALIDEYLLMIHPLVLGTGRRLFPDGGAAARLRLVDGRAAPKGVLVATYHPAEG